MNTIIYFIRHAESPYIENMERERGLSEKGLLDSYRIVSAFTNVKVDVCISSPYKRAIQTIEPLAALLNVSIIESENMKERHIGKINCTFQEAKKKVYANFHYQFEDGESSIAAQKRSITALQHIIDTYRGKAIAISTHGDIMTLMMNNFNPIYGYMFWQSTSMPDLYKLTINEKNSLTKVERMWDI